MPNIKLLSQETIDKIAAGEVIERPSSVVKELVENAIDAKATAITVEIKEGGISLIRITDNGCGIAFSEVETAFLRHSTSKISSVEDLLSVSSLGFRGEALSSIAAVSRVELITKTPDQLTGCRYLIEGSKEIAKEEIGAPDGTTFLVKDLFYNTPARKKFLKTAQTEAGYISDIVEKLALSHPDISFKFINNNQTKLHTSGNGNRKDMIYHIFGREITSALLEVDYNCEFFHVTGFIGKPIVTRGNRNYENYFINGRYIKSALLSKAIEEAYKNFMMQHQYPFTVLYFAFHGELLDVNVHPTKMELRFEHNQEIYKELCDALFAALSNRDLIPSVPVTEEKEKPPVRVYEEPIPEPFETRRLNDIRKAVAKDSPYEVKYPQHERPAMALQGRRTENAAGAFAHANGAAVQAETIRESVTGYSEIKLEDISPSFLTADAKKRHRIIGQVFKTYWLVEYEDELFIIDQHAAHEKVLYERTMASLAKKEYTSQVLSPPIIISLDAREEEMLHKFQEQIEQLGYVVEHFGGKEYQISGVPGNLFHLDMKDLFIEMLDDFSNLSGRETPQLILEKVASMSCKAAVKGNHTLSLPEIEALIDELLTLENPYNCPHGRPTIISMSKYELEKKFKRIV
jgi:DNA mismatch repair protein MutL